MASRKSSASKPKAGGSGAGGVRRTRPNAREAHFRSPQSDPGAAAHHTPLTPQDWYWREKERRAQRRTSPAQDLLEEARLEFRALLEAEASSGKGGRPRKSAAPKKRAAGEGTDFEPGDDFPDEREEGVPEDGGAEELDD